MEEHKNDNYYHDISVVIQNKHRFIAVFLSLLLTDLSFNFLDDLSLRHPLRHNNVNKSIMLMLLYVCIL